MTQHYFLKTSQLLCLGSFIVIVASSFLSPPSFFCSRRNQNTWRANKSFRLSLIPNFLRTFVCVCENLLFLDFMVCWCCCCDNGDVYWYRYYRFIKDIIVIITTMVNFTVILYILIHCFSQRVFLLLVALVSLLVYSLVSGITQKIYK